MGSGNYKEVFLQEAREQLDNLNDGILSLEKNPENKDFVNIIFRACHTIKGNAAMMGYTHFSELAHRMENVLGAVRDDKITVNKEIVDLLLNGSDALEEGLDIIREKNDDEEVSQNEVNNDLEKALEKTQASSKIKKITVSEKVKLSEEQKKQVKAEKEKGNEVYRIVIAMDPRNELNGPKTQILMRKCKSNISKVIYANPEFEEIKSGKVSMGFELVISTSQSKKEVEDSFNSIAGSKGYVMDPEDEFEVPDVFKDEKKEEAEKKDKRKDLTQSVSKPIQSIKVDVKKLDNLVNMIGELLISNMRLNEISKSVQSNELRDVVNKVDMLTTNIQEEVMQQRMVPVGQIFSRFPRLVRDLSAQEGKKVELIIRGEEIELDRNILDEIGEPMVHIMRNSIDHGIESPDERLNAGKPESGTVHLTARREKNTAVIEIRDDGKGIDAEKVKEAAVSKNIVSEEHAEKLDKQKKLMLIFQPGLSTKKNVTDISGRGVGMDVVLNKIKKLGGNVKLESTVGKGSTIELHLPLTLAIISSLIVKVDHEKYAIPLNNVVETIDLHEDKIKTIQGNEVIVMRGEDIPLIRLGQYFGNPPKEGKVFPTVIVEESEYRAGLMVDTIINQQPILIKNLHDLVRGVSGIAGATILGDGKVCRILDVGSLMK